MWRMEPTNGWQLSALGFQQTNPAEIAHLLRNLSHYMAQLRVCKSHKSIEALYLHNEVSSVVSIDQGGLEDGLVESRVYAFPDESKRILYLLCVGKASEKNADMEYCKTAVLDIVMRDLETV
jgi:hypothetical protein